jgi:predicted Rossmann-fold nucleotide-binding protein
VDLYDPERTTLYTHAELMAGWSEDAPRATLDRRIHQHVERTGGRFPGIVEGLAQTLHDYGIERALQRLLSGEDAGRPRRVVGMMGEHRVARSDPSYRTAVETAWLLSRAGYLVASGGGLGIMEAANLGAYLAPFEAEAIDRALAVLAQAPTFAGHAHEYVAAALAVREQFGTDADGGAGDNLAVATWMYEDEPISHFASHIAKYFQNSIREDGLLAIATYGVVYLPGGFGTLQEVFQDAAQNENPQFAPPSPMIFLGDQYDESRPGSPVPVLRARAPRWEPLVHVATSPEDVVAFVDAHAGERTPGPRAAQRDAATPSP